MDGGMSVSGVILMVKRFLSWDNDHGHSPWLTLGVDFKTKRLALPENALMLKERAFGSDASLFIRN